MADQIKSTDLSEIINSRINEILESKLGLESPSIYEVPQKVLLEDSEVLFRQLEIVHDEIISGSIHSDTIADDYGQGTSTKGKTTFFRVDNQIKSAVFIMSNISDDKKTTVLRYVALLHELGHVSDMENGKNIRFNGHDINMIKAEGYAEVFALKYLDKKKNDIVDKFVKGRYAQALLDRKNKNEMYASIHKEILVYFRESRLRNWANSF
ncbi:hypothetical protein ACJJIK_09655 [Microbulbifer sp. ZKSA006]|uniref:hypothetical protein n=1 Tax=Microbulbifer sp. ZKSA006 TaxID=3243390 RepID=UPI0040396C7F